MTIHMQMKDIFEDKRYLFDIDPSWDFFFTNQVSDSLFHNFIVSQCLRTNKVLYSMVTETRSKCGIKEFYRYSDYAHLPTDEVVTKAVITGKHDPYFCLECKSSEYYSYETLNKEVKKIRSHYKLAKIWDRSFMTLVVFNTLEIPNPLGPIFLDTLKFAGLRYEEKGPESSEYNSKTNRLLNERFSSFIPFNNYPRIIITERVEPSEIIQWIESNKESLKEVITNYFSINDKKVTSYKRDSAVLGYITNLLYQEYKDNNPDRFWRVMADDLEEVERDRSDRSEGSVKYLPTFENADPENLRNNYEYFHSYYNFLADK